MVSKIKLRFTISVGEKSRVPFGTDGLMDAIACKDTILCELGLCAHWILAVVQLILTSLNLKNPVNPYYI
jgi:hypothetical protein